MEIYTDGACSGNPGFGGWAVWIPDIEKEISGSEESTTNNRMELTAAINAAKEVQEFATIFTDSNYVVNGITSWIYDWRRSNWVNSKRQPVSNKDLWVELWDACAGKDITWKWVKGHSKNPGNDRADKLATNMIYRG